MRILFVYPNSFLNVGVPPGVALLSAVLKREGHEVDIFDFTFVKRRPLPEREDSAETGIFLPTATTVEDLVREDPVRSLEEAFRDKLAAFDPELICLSSMTGLFDRAVELLRSCRDAYDCHVTAGGVHATIASEDALDPDVIDTICVGEGELFLPELARLLEEGRDYRGLSNLGWKENGEKRFNGYLPFADLDALPDPDWDLFDDRHLFRPYMGQVYKGGFVLMSRGCPYRCTYCVNSPLRRRLKGCGRYFRVQSPARTVAQIANFKERYGATWFKFGDDTIMTLKEEQLEELADGLEPLNIMFGCSVRPETTTARKAELLKRMGCVATSIGLESGDEELRRNALNRTMSNDDIRNAVRVLKDNGIRVSTFNMIGLPGETREQVFKTIALNRELDSDSANVFILYPYPGTQIAIDHEIPLRDDRGHIVPVTEASGFALSRMDPEEVEGLHRAFNLYMSLPESLWPVVRIAEGDDEQGHVVHEALTRYVRERLAEGRA